MTGRHIPGDAEGSHDTGGDSEGPSVQPSDGKRKLKFAAEPPGIWPLKNIYSFIIKKMTILINYEIYKGVKFKKCKIINVKK